MNRAELELNLLKYWKKYDIKWLYKYKHRLKVYEEQENRVNIELFTDITSGSLFQDITDIANHTDIGAEDAKVSIDSLIAKRENL